MSWQILVYFYNGSSDPAPASAPGYMLVKVCHQQTGGLEHWQLKYFWGVWIAKEGTQGLPDPLTLLLDGEAVSFVSPKTKKENEAVEIRRAGTHRTGWLVRRKIWERNCCSCRFGESGKEENEEIWGKVDFTNKTDGGVHWRKEVGADEANFGKLELLIAHLLSQVAQVTLFICWWLILWRKLHTPSFAQNKHVSQRGGWKSGLQCATSVEVFLSGFFWCMRKS